MHQVKINIVHAKLIEGIIERRLDRSRVVLVVPELGGDEDLVSRDAGFANAGAHGGLGAVDVGGVDVSVASFERGGYGVFLGVFVLPGAEA